MCGEFVGCYIGFIVEVDSEKDLVLLDVVWFVVLEEVGFNFLVCDVLNDLKDFFEVVCFVFCGWMLDGGFVVEYEFVCAFRDGTSVAKLFLIYVCVLVDIILMWF